MRRLIMVLLLAAVVFPGALPAQSKRKTGRQPIVIVKHRNDNRCCWGNRWLLEPYAGAFNDAYDASPDGNETGLLLGMRIGYLLGGRTRLLANVGYSQTDNVANPQGLPNYFVYDNTWVFTTGGAEFDVVPGRTSASLGVQAGAAWRRVDLDGEVGSPIGTPQPDEGFSAQEIIVPGLIARHRLTSRATLTAGLHDYIFDFMEGPTQHSVAFTAGVSFR